MNLIISFSGRSGGNCDGIAEFIRKSGDKVIHIREQDIHPCSGCEYECFRGICRYRDDDAYGIYSEMCDYEKVILIVPMYCGNPCSLYFSFKERCQDYFMHNDNDDEIIRRLHIIGVYGSEKDTPDFIPCLEKWFHGSPYQGRVLGIQRHIYVQKMTDSVLDVAEIRNQIEAFFAQ